MATIVKSIVKGEISIIKSDPKELATLVMNKAIDECDKNWRNVGK